ncbi:hypothetical protein MMMB2_4621 [Mycobacterium marinum MB2]|nr:hypothetical protein MMMB2_4621 [Mycobacterium marinum MB2]
MTLAWVTVAEDLSINTIMPRLGKWLARAMEHAGLLACVA